MSASISRKKKKKGPQTKLLRTKGCNLTRYIARRRNQRRGKPLLSCVKDSRVRREPTKQANVKRTHQATPESLSPALVSACPVVAPLATLLYAFYLESESLTPTGAGLIYLNCFPNFHSPPLPWCALDTITTDAPPSGKGLLTPRMDTTLRAIPD